MQDVMGAILAAATLKSRGLPSRQLLPDYIELPDTTEFYDKVMDAATELVNDRDKAEEVISYLLADLLDAYEHQGFINGFRYGFMLAKEMGPAETKEAIPNE